MITDFDLVYFTEFKRIFVGIVTKKIALRNIKTIKNAYIH